MFGSLLAQHHQLQHQLDPHLFLQLDPHLFLQLDPHLFLQLDPHLFLRLDPHLFLRLCFRHLLSKRQPLSQLVHQLLQVSQQLLTLVIIHKLNLAICQIILMEQISKLSPLSPLAVVVLKNKIHFLLL
jgi:hypothetical protein